MLHIYVPTQISKDQRGRQRDRQANNQAGKPASKQTNNSTIDIVNWLESHLVLSCLMGRIAKTLESCQSYGVPRDPLSLALVCWVAQRPSGQLDVRNGEDVLLVTATLS